MQSCYKDESTSAIMNIPEVRYSNVNPEYILTSLVDTLKIKPVLAEDVNADAYTYQWLLYTTNHNPANTELAKADTLGNNKDLAYFIVQKPGKYILTFNIKHKESGIINITRYDVTISTRTMNGWYLLKDENNETDLDFFHAKGEIRNWIAYFNGGKSLPGNSIKTIFVPGMKTKISSTDLFGALGVLTDKDAGIYKLADGSVQYRYDNMFFVKPAIRKPENLYMSMGGTLVMINDSQANIMYRGSYFGDAAINSYRIANKAAISAIDIYFDDRSKSLIYLSGLNFREFLSNGNTLKNTGMDLLWMEGYVYPRNSTSLLLKNPTTKTGRLIKIASNPTDVGTASRTLVTKDTLIASTFPILSADIIGGSYDNDILYYAKGNQLFAMDYSSLESTLQTTFGLDEKITLIQHIKYPVPGANVVNKINYLAVATYANGRYKVWLFSINSLGRLVPKTTPDFQGSGRVTCVTYLENGEGSRTF
ncbi:PKD-like family lipoprotein [Sphingobacterium sp. MYb382]